MTEKSDLDPIDRDALERSIVAVLADRATAGQFQRKLQHDGWYAAAILASFSIQIDNLGLRPDQTPPSAGHGHDADADRLLDRLLSAGLSQYEPDPFVALLKKET